MVRNPHIQDLAEWVAYHLVRGASRVLIYDHGRVDGHSRGIESPYQPLQGWLDDGLVEIHTRLSPQACARNRYADEGRLSTPDVFWKQAMLTDAQMRICDEFSWVAFLDHDEFLNTQSSAPLPLVFDAHATPATAVLQVQMRRFGNSGHYLRPRGLVLENYTWRERDFPLDVVKDGRRRVPLEFQGNGTKSVVSPSRVLGPDYGNHTWLPVHGFKRQQLDPDVVRLNHYFTKSVEDWIDTAMLGSAKGHRPHRHWGIFDSLAVPTDGDTGLIKTRPLVEDRHIRHHIPKVREELTRVGFNIELASSQYQEF